MKLLIQWPNPISYSILLNKGKDSKINVCMYFVVVQSLPTGTSVVNICIFCLHSMGMDRIRSGCHVLENHLYFVTNVSMDHWT